ncbi:hypothetical protein B0T16DRAFT_461446 [Cercophora newfieldiana]|uniref:Uncharacterized protein n=1 Tax=Cercophora newfieldiana TaxID=92897 RepID=A0AA39XW55_9PEZI|nr:hypothetical protein B0T16DRAFT_461446 [Cercophora newfieldiana]
MASRIPKRLALAAIMVALAARPATAFTRYENDGSCQIVGDTDIYGIGVRVGYYLTYFAGVLALCFNNNKGITDSLKSINIIFGAILIVLLRNATLGSFAVLEWQIASVLVFVLPLSSMILAFLLGSPGLASWGTFFILYGLYSALQPWLFWTRIDQGRDLSCPSIRMFIFAVFDFYHPSYVKFLRAMSIIACICSPVALIGGITLIVMSMKGKKSVRDTIVEKMREATQDGSSDIDLSVIKRSPVFRLIVIPLLFGGCTGIVSVEKLISLNSIDLSDVEFLSTGQLIPFLVGLFTFISTIWGIITNKDDDDDD